MREIWAVTDMALCILTVLSIQGRLGVVGHLWNSFLTPIFGWGLYAVPVFLGGISLALFFARQIRFDATRIFGLILLSISVLGTLHLAVPEDQIYEVARAGQYGGYIGFVSSFISRQILGVTGSYVVFLALFLISVLLTFSVSIRDVLSLVEFKIPAWFSQKPEIKKRPIVTGEEPEEFDDEDEDDEEMVIHTLPTTSEEEMLNVRPVDPNTEDEDMDVDVDLKEEEGEKIPVEKIAQALDEAEAGAEKKEEKPWVFPPLDLLSERAPDVAHDPEILREKAEVIRNKLAQFGIQVRMNDVHVGPTVIQFTLKPHEGVKLSKITGLKNDLALALSANAIRIEAPIPGKPLVGIEVPNDTRAIVRLRELLEDETYAKLQAKTKSKLIIPFGRDVSGTPIVGNLSTMPHMLVAGSTGSGKSVFTNAILLSFLYNNSPRDLRLILNDPKQVELSTYNGIPHLLTPVITEPERAAIALRWVVAEMTRRYTVYADSGHRNIDEYNGDPNTPQHMPKIVVVIDELADLMMVAGKEVEASICRIAQLARAVGIHLVVATQRPSVDVITGLIKANIPARVAFTVASSIDSRTILDSIGAEDLLGNGDMLFLSGATGKFVRVQGVYVSSQEIQKVTNNVKLTLQGDEPTYNEEVTAKKTASLHVQGVPASQMGDDDDDELYDQALAIVKRSQKASATMLQRYLKVGYSRAARLIDMLERNGVVSPGDGAKPRTVLVGRGDVVEEMEMQDAGGEFDEGEY
jgi:S-DNA-T family DNA segregation ATPase FtsK/SpoIIIE